MYKSRHYALAALVCLPWFPTVMAETLQQAVSATIARFPEIQAAQHRREAVRAQIGQARAELFPSLSGSVGEGRERSRNVSTRGAFDDPALKRREAEVSVTQLVFDGGAASGQVRRFASRAEGAEFTVTGTIEEISFRAGQAFVEVRRLREQLAVARENIGVHEKTLSDVAELADAGRGRRADVTQAQARRALAASSADQLAGQLAQAESAFRHFTGRPPGELEPPPTFEPVLPARLEQAVADALGSHPAVKAAEKELEAAQHDRESARARLALPRVTIEAGASRNRDLDGIAGANADQYAMLRLRYNFFRGFGDNERVRETEARIDEALAELTRVRNEVERDIRQAWDALVADRSRLPQLAQYARASADVAEAYRLQFQLGQRSLLDVLNGENERYSAFSAYIAGVAAVTADELRLLASQGRLADALRVPLPPGAARPADSPPVYPPAGKPLAAGPSQRAGCGDASQCLVLRLDSRMPDGTGLDRPLSASLR